MRSASYVVNGLEKVFRAILNARHWETGLPEAFGHFLTEPVKFDSDPGPGCGALSWYLTSDNRTGRVKSSS